MEHHGLNCLWWDQWLGTLEQDWVLDTVLLSRKQYGVLKEEMVTRDMLKD